jgi:hypothetical protein
MGRSPSATELGKIHRWAASRAASSVAMPSAMFGLVHDPLLG